MSSLRHVLVAGIAAAVTFTACGDDPVSPGNPTPAVSAYDADVAVQWFDLYMDLTQATPGYTPPVASRTFGYAGVALYEALRPGMTGYVTLAGQVNALTAVPHPEFGDRYHWPTVANAALASLARLYHPGTSQDNRNAIDQLEGEILAGFTGTVDAEILDRSASRGLSVANHIYAWSVSDRGHEGWARNFPGDFVPPVGEGLWVPTPRTGGDPQPALQPYWGGCRPFTLPPGDPNAACDPGSPPAFSTEPGSAFHTEAFEVYQAVENLTQEQLDIALFWADDPGATATPPGHTISIVNQVLLLEDAGLDVAAEAYARVGMAVADAFIACWESKYRYNLVRPVTYIREVWDADWLPPVNTPPFPEYTSGHSVQSGAGFQVLSELFGADYVFTDHTHDGRGLAPRTFSSFEEAAEEAAISRLYGGIHFRAAIDLGVDQGRCVAARVMQIQMRAAS